MPTARSSGRHGHVLAVDERDHPERDQVVDDDHGEHEGPQAIAGGDGPTSASIPRAKAVSVDIATPQPCSR